MQYSIAIKPISEDCPSGKCFLGWVQFYTVQGETFIGYPNPQLPVQPVFSWKGTSKDNYTLTYSKDLGRIWK